MYFAHMNDKAWKAPNGWKPNRGWIGNRLGKRLTDKKIAKYQKQGWYDPVNHKARIDKATKKSKRVGNWVESDGGMVYAPE